jgi:hypothetical protein
MGFCQVETPAVVCCEGELFWIEVHPPPGATDRKLEVTPNHPMAISVQGLRSGVVGRDILPGLVGWADLVNLVKFELGCMGPAPVVAVAMDTINRPGEVHLAVPRWTRTLKPTVPEPDPPAEPQPLRR